MSSRSNATFVFPSTISFAQVQLAADVIGALPTQLGDIKAGRRVNVGMKTGGGAEQSRDLAEMGIHHYYEWEDGGEYEAGCSVVMGAQTAELDLCGSGPCVAMNLETGEIDTKAAEAFVKLMRAAGINLRDA